MVNNVNVCIFGHSSVNHVSVDSTSKHRVAVDEHGVEVQRLQETLRQRDAEIRAMRDADAHRAAALQSAVNNYVTRSPYSAA